LVSSYLKNCKSYSNSVKKKQKQTWIRVKSICLANDFYAIAFVLVDWSPWNNITMILDTE
jgi:hypothetical protein